MKFPPFLHSHLRLTLLGTPPNRVFYCRRVLYGWFAGSGYRERHNQVDIRDASIRHQGY